MTTRRLLIPSVCALGSVLALLGCETRVVRYNPILGGLPGAESGRPVVRDFGDYRDPSIISEDQIVQEEPDGKKTLIARTGRHLILHIYNTIEDGEKDLFVGQVLSKKTRDECAAMGVDPGSLYDELCEQRLDVYDLFNLMPMGERTPGAVMTPVGAGVQRVSISGLGTSGLRFRAMDMVMEGGNWRLRWFVDEP